MPVGTKRKRAEPNGLSAGERLKRDKLAGPELYSQWGWVPRISEPSQITLDHRLAACGFHDKLGKPICRNKYAGLGERDQKKRKVDVPQKAEAATPAEGEDADDVIVISSDDDLPPCNKKRCKDNPQCTNYLGQVKLENEDEALKSFLKIANTGHSPLSNAREPDLPIGLRNLGATCYANAFIQVWFQDLAFRHGVYKCKPSQEDGKDLEDSPIFQLQVTFAALQESTQIVFNPIKLVESLQLRASEQQDAQEFSKLFMSHLATEFEKQVVPSLKTLISDQFEGKQVYGTMCNKCHHRSEREAGFLELEINLENNGKLEDRVQALLQSEELTGDNMYYCTLCGSLQDATRYTKIRRLPPVLHFSVLRFVFDLATLSRKKSKQTILFPPIIDMSPFLDKDVPESSVPTQAPSKRQHHQSDETDGRSDMIYELRGVLLHKGPSAYHGHYEAQVFDVITRRFYQFNDETVTPIASLQSKKGTSNGDKEIADDNVSAAANKKRRTYSRKQVRVDDSDGEGEMRSSSKKDNKSGYISSKDAYMLIYARREIDHLEASRRHVPEPPPAARDRIAALNKLHDETCTSYLEKESRLTESFKRMRQNKMSIYQQWEIVDFREESAVVSRSALEDWLMRELEEPKTKKHTKEDPHNLASSRKVSEERTPDLTREGSARSESPDDPLDLLAPPCTPHGYLLDNSAIVCHHGALDPNRAVDMKRIKKDSLVAIRDDTGCIFEPELTTTDVCERCITEMFIEKRYAIDHPSQVSQFDELNAAESDTQGAWVSKMWIKDWRQARPKMHITGEDDPPPDAPEYAAHVVCAHGQLSLGSSSRKRINGEASVFLQSLFPTWSPVSGDARACEACDEELHHSKETKQELKKQIEHEKIKLRNIIPFSMLALEPEIIPGRAQAIVPTDFLRQWRAWINRPHEMSRPGPVDNTRFLCEHDLLIIDPNVTKDMATAISLVSLSDWATLQELYGGGPLIALTGIVQESQESEPINSVAHDIEVCYECRNNRLSNFETAAITIQILGDNEPNPAPDRHGKPNGNDASSGTFKANGATGVSINIAKHGQSAGRPSRTSDRLRNSRRKVGRKDITIQKTSTVKDIKIELHNELNIPTICQRLFFRGVELTDNSATSASLGIMADDTLYLREEKEDNDALNSDAEPEPSRQRREEGRAFGGTVLSGFSKKATTPGEEVTDREFSPDITRSSDSCPACTFINPDGSSTCDICGTQLNV